MTVFAGDRIRAADVNKAMDKRIGTTTGTTDGSASSGTTEAVNDTITVTVVSGYTYRLKAVFYGTGSVANDEFLVKLREGTGTGGTQLGYGRLVIRSATSFVYTITVEVDWTASSSGSQSFASTRQRDVGTGTLTPKGATSSPRSLTVEYVEG